MLIVLYNYITESQESNNSDSDDETNDNFLNEVRSNGDSHSMSNMSNCSSSSSDETIDGNQENVDLEDEQNVITLIVHENYFEDEDYDTDNLTTEDETTESESESEVETEVIDPAAIYDINEGNTDIDVPKVNGFLQESDADDDKSNCSNSSECETYFNFESELSDQSTIVANNDVEVSAQEVSLENKQDLRRASDGEEDVQESESEQSSSDSELEYESHSECKDSSSSENSDSESFELQNVYPKDSPNFSNWRSDRYSSEEEAEQRTSKCHDSLENTLTSVVDTYSSSVLPDYGFSDSEM